MKRLIPIALLASCICAIPAFAVLDTNENGLSDLWEMTYNNGNLFGSSFTSAGDDDTDGWNNAQEASAGTNPFDANPPDGHLQPLITHIPAILEDTDSDGIPDAIVTPDALTLTWPTIAGKQYILMVSPDLVEWLQVDQDPYISSGLDVEYNIVLPNNDKLFWRVKIEDVDTDGDGLTNAEEVELGLDPNNPETIPGLSDSWVAENFTSELIGGGVSAVDSDPDGDGLTNKQEQFLQTDPNVSDNPGILQDAIRNGDFSVPSIDGTQENPGLNPNQNGTEPNWNYWAGLNEQVGEQSWKAATEPSYPNIEYQRLDGSSNQYCELKADPSGNYGIKQKVGTREGATYLLMFDCSTRNGIDASDNNITVKVDGSEVGTVEFDTSLNGEWLTKVFTFNATQVITEIALVPQNPSSMPTYGCYVDNVRLLTVEVDFIMPDSQDWEDVSPDNRVILHDENTRVRIKINGISLYATQMDQTGLDGLYLKTSITRAGLPEVLLEFTHVKCNVIPKPNLTEIRYELNKFDLMSLSLLPPSGQPDLPLYSALDYNAGAPSNFLDSQAFLDRMTIGFQGFPAGYANNKPDVNLSSVPPQSLPHKTFMQAAGAEVLSARVGAITKLGQVMNQGEIFYFSGHGSPGDYLAGPTFPISDTEVVDGSDLNNYWNKNLEIAIIAGCSVVNVNNWYPTDPTYFPGTFGPGAGYYPGKFMNTTGPRFIFGYGSSAPTDEQNSDTIIAEFVDTYLESPDDPFTAWKQANDNPNGRNATAIEKNTRFGFFEKITFLGITVGYDWTTKNCLVSRICVSKEALEDPQGYDKERV